SATSDHGLGSWSRACLASSSAWVCASACSGVIRRLRGRAREAPALPDAAPGLVPLAAAERVADLPRFPAASFVPAGDVGVPVPADLSTEAGPVPVAVFFAVRLGGEPADVFADAVFFAFPVAAFLVAA